MLIDEKAINKALSDFITSHHISDWIYGGGVGETKDIEYTLCEIEGASKLAKMLKEVIRNKN